MMNDLLSHFLKDLCHRLLVWIGLLALLALSLSPHPEKSQAREREEREPIVLLAKSEPRGTQGTTRVE